MTVHMSRKAVEVDASSEGSGTDYSEDEILVLKKDDGFRPVKGQPGMYYKVIIFSDLVDLWVIKIKEPIILCACRVHVIRAQCADQAARTVYLFGSIIYFYFEKFPRCAKVCGLFFFSSLCFPGADWLGR